jgi:hypothetical protein
MIVIDQCKIMEQGNYQGLFAKGGHYATLYNTSLGTRALRMWNRPDNLPLPVDMFKYLSR